MVDRLCFRLEKFTLLKCQGWTSVAVWSITIWIFSRVRCFCDWDDWDIPDSPVWFLSCSFLIAGLIQWESWLFTLLACFPSASLLYLLVPSRSVHLEHQIRDKGSWMFSHSAARWHLLCRLQSQLRCPAGDKVVGRPSGSTMAALTRSYQNLKQKNTCFRSHARKMPPRPCGASGWMNELTTFCFCWWLTPGVDIRVWGQVEVSMIVSFIYAVLKCQLNFVLERFNESPFRTDTLRRIDISLTSSSRLCYPESSADPRGWHRVHAVCLERHKIQSKHQGHSWEMWVDSRSTTPVRVMLLDKPEQEVTSCHTASPSQWRFQLYRKDRKHFLSKCFASLLFPVFHCFVHAFVHDCIFFLFPSCDWLPHLH